MGMRILRVGIDDAPPMPLQFGNPETADFRGYEAFAGSDVAVAKYYPEDEKYLLEKSPE